MASKYIKDDKNKKPSKNSRQNAKTAFEKHSKYAKADAVEETEAVEKSDDVEESGYIKGSKRVRSYQSRIDEEKRKEREAFQAELERRRADLIEKKRQEAEAEGRADFDAGDIIIDDAELELDMHREGETALVTTDGEVIDHDVNEYGLSTGEESEEMLAKLKKEKAETGLSVSNPKILRGLKAGTTKSLASEEKSYQHSVIATWMAAIALIFIGVVLQFANVHLPFMPVTSTLDFSAFPELIAGVAYGPIVGVLVIFIKNILHSGVYYLVYGVPSFVNEISNFAIDTLYVVIASLIYNFYKGNQRKKMLLPNFKDEMKLGKKKLRHRSRFIFIGGTFGSAAVSIASMFWIVYVAFPMFIKFYAETGINEYYFLKAYLDCNPNIENLMQGALYYNVPYNFIRMYIITIVVALIYKPISPILHGNLKALKSK